MNTYNSKPWETRNQDHHQYGASSKGEGESYHKSDSKYGAGGELGSEYMRGKEAKEKKDQLTQELEEKKDTEMKEEDIPFKAAKQVFMENKQEQSKDNPRKKT